MFKPIIKNLPFHNFEKEKVLICQISESVTLGEKEPFKAYIVVDLESGEEKYLTASHSIDKAISMIDITKDILRIEFLEKSDINGKPFNKFNIDSCSLKDYQSGTKN